MTPPGLLVAESIRDPIALKKSRLTRKRNGEVDDCHSAAANYHVMVSALHRGQLASSVNSRAASHRWQCPLRRARWNTKALASLRVIGAWSRSNLTATSGEPPWTVSPTCRLSSGVRSSGTTIAPHRAHSNVSIAPLSTGRSASHASPRTQDGPQNTGDKLRAFSTLNARLLHPLVRRLDAPWHYAGQYHAASNSGPSHRLHRRRAPSRAQVWRGACSKWQGLCRRCRLA
jgi:hypothetical protein